MSLFYSNPLDGWVGIFTIPCESVDAVTQLNYFDYRGFYCQIFAHFLPPTLVHFLDVVFFFNEILTFSLSHKCVQCQARESSRFWMLPCQQFSDYLTKAITSFLLMTFLTKINFYLLLCFLEKHVPSVSEMLLKIFYKSGRVKRRC